MILRTEHPNPQFEREHWICLNGEWEFLLDPSISGKQRKLFLNQTKFDKKINVPFCMESELSGIAEKDFINSVWYRKSITITSKQLCGRVFLNFGAVDYQADIYINEQLVSSHKGGQVSFKTEITDYLNIGENTIVVNAIDDTRDKFNPTGKQSQDFASSGCFYTRTTGIWQTVWLEFTPKEYIKKVRYLTDTDNAILTITAELIGCGELCAEAFFSGKSVGKARCYSNGTTATLSLKLEEKHLWCIGDGKLYDLNLSFNEDNVKSYFALRNICIDGRRVLVNGESVFWRLILDQGFYPNGIYTAPSEKELLGDIERSIAMGFNGARLHQKIFEQRFLYHCDRLGYIVWGEYPSWGLDYTYPESIHSILPEWLEVVERDFNHPSIVAWCPFNETWDIKGRKQCDDVIKTVYLATKALDPTRPCIDTSGNFHTATDIYDIHDYNQEPAIFASHYEKMKENPKAEDFYEPHPKRQKYDGKAPYCVSEYGGIAWGNTDGWGYGESPKTQEDFLNRLSALTKALLQNKNIFCFCYTQLTDVEQEQNGLYYYDRRPKFDTEIIKKIISQKAAIEE